MATTLFSDAIISATELKNNQRKWFTRALETPVTITNRGGRQFVLINREQIRNLVLVRDYSEQVVKYCQEVQEKKGDFTSDVFPWTQYLSKEDRLEFRDELVSVFAELIRNNNWANLEEIIGSWEATAEALTNSRFMEVVNSEPGQKEYVEID